jgi:hypothetical protein
MIKFVEYLSIFARWVTRDRPLNVTEVDSSSRPMTSILYEHTNDHEQ